MLAAMSATNRPVAVVVGATSKWQADGRNTKLAHGKAVDDSHLPVGVRWGVGGAIAQKFAKEGFVVALTTRKAANAAGLEKAITEQGGASFIVELDLVSQESIAKAFAAIRERAGDPDVLVYNAGYLEGRDLPPDKELLEQVPLDILETAQHIASRGPFLVAKEVLPAMRTRRRLLPHLEQRVVVTGTEAADRPIALLSARHDAHAGAGADRGVFRAWRARRQRRDRWPHRLAGDPGPRARPGSIRRS